MGQDNGPVLARYGLGWRQQRRACHLHLTKNAVFEYHDFITQEARSFIVRLHANPKDFAKEFRLWASFFTLARWHDRLVAQCLNNSTASRLILGVTYALDIKGLDDPVRSHWLFFTLVTLTLIYWMWWKDCCWPWPNQWCLGGSVHPSLPCSLANMSAWSLSWLLFS